MQSSSFSVKKIPSPAAVVQPVFKECKTPSAYAYSFKVRFLGSSEGIRPKVSSYDESELVIAGHNYAPGKTVLLRLPSEGTFYREQAKFIDVFAGTVRHLQIDESKDTGWDFSYPGDLRLAIDIETLERMQEQIDAAAEANKLPTIIWAGLQSKVTF